MAQSMDVTSPKESVQSGCRARVPRGMSRPDQGIDAAGSLLAEAARSLLVATNTIGAWSTDRARRAARCNKVPAATGTRAGQAGLPHIGPVAGHRAWSTGPPPFQRRH